MMSSVSSWSFWIPNACCACAAADKCTIDRPTIALVASRRDFEIRDLIVTHLAIAVGKGFAGGRFGPPAGQPHLEMCVPPLLGCPEIGSASWRERVSSAVVSAG